MSINPYADGSAEDLIRTIIHVGASEYHALSLYQKAMAELENGLVDVEDTDTLNLQLTKAERYKNDLISLADLRRTAMHILFNMFDGDKDVWCQVKHLGIAYITAVESFQTSEDMAVLELAKEINKKFTEALTAFLGAEITDCASCLGDFLKGEANDSSKRKHGTNLA